MWSILGNLHCNRGLHWRKKLLGFHQFFKVFLFLKFFEFQYFKQIISRKFDIFTNKLNIAKCEKVLQYIEPICNEWRKTIMYIISLRTKTSIQAKNNLKIAANIKVYHKVTLSWSLIWPSNPCFIPNWSAALKWAEFSAFSWNWISVQKICMILS
jgi:hypothetical protein